MSKVYFCVINLKNMYEYIGCQHCGRGWSDWQFTATCCEVFTIYLILCFISRSGLNKTLTKPTPSDFFPKILKNREWHQGLWYFFFLVILYLFIFKWGYSLQNKSCSTFWISSLFEHKFLSFVKYKVSCTLFDRFLWIIKLEYCLQ